MKQFCTIFNYLSTIETFINSNLRKKKDSIFDLRRGDLLIFLKSQISIFLN